MFVKKSKINLTLGIAAAGLFVGCNRGPMGPAGPELSGNISGFVALVNETGSQPTNRDSVRVTLIGVDSTWTDSTGKWMIPNVHTGTYTLTYSKSGYGISKSVQAQILGGSNRILGTIYLCQAPTLSLDSLHQIGVPKNGDSATVFVKAQISDLTVSASYRTYLILSRDTNITSTLSLYQTATFFNTNFAKGIDSITIKVTPVIFANAGFQPGDTVYAAAFLATDGGNTSGYLDTLTDKTVVTNLNASRSNLLQWVVPAAR